MKKKILLATILLVLLCLPISACVPQYPQEDGKINIAVSIAPYADFVRQIGGDKVNVYVLVPPGRTPHDYEPPPSVMVRIAQADAYFACGSGVDVERQYLENILAQNENLALYDLSSNIELIDYDHDHEDENDNDLALAHSHDGADPHVWTSISNSIIIAENICKALSKISPEESAYFESNLAIYTQKANLLINDITELFLGNRIDSFMMYHGSLSYFVHDFGLHQISIKEEGKEVTPATLAEKIDLAKELGIKIVYIEREYPDSIVKVVAEELDGTTLPIDALPENYLETMWQNALNLAEGLK